METNFEWKNTYLKIRNRANVDSREPRPKLGAKSEPRGAMRVSAGHRMPEMSHANEDIIGRIHDRKLIDEAVHEHKLRDSEGSRKGKGKWNIFQLKQSSTML